jgi:uncharacterized membrane protein HdeD (DUF308 family)
MKFGCFIYIIGILAIGFGVYRLDGDSRIWLIILGVFWFFIGLILMIVNSKGLGNSQN